MQTVLNFPFTASTVCMKFIRALHLNLPAKIGRQDTLSGLPTEALA